MRVPVPTSGRVIPKVQDAYVQASPNAFAGAEAFTRSVQGFGKNLSALGAAFQERDQKTDKFNSLTNLSKFDQDMSESLTELKRGYAPDGKGYTKTAEGLYDEKAANYLASVPADLQNEFRYRIAENKKGIIADSLSFQYQAGDAFFKQGVSDEFDKSRSLLDQAPGALDAQRAHMQEIVDATDLPEIEKTTLKRNINIGLEAATYKAEVRKDASTRMSIGVGDIADYDTGARAIIKKEEGYVPTAMWDVNHHRVGYSSDTTTSADGTVHPVKEGDVTTREDAERDLTRRIKAADTAGSTAVGPDRWNSLGANVKAGLASVYYHYGKYPQEVIRAVETGSNSDIASAVRGLSSNPDRRAREAKIIEGSAGIEADPRFQNIPYEDRLALRQDADREAARGATEAAKVKKAQTDLMSNDLYLGLLDGTKGKTDIDTARQAGWLTDYDSINKANNILKEANVQTVLAGEAAQKLSGGGTFDPTDVDDKKRLNAYIGKGGLSRISSGDQDYFHNSIIPLVSQTGDVPTDVAGTLMGMVRANDSQKAMFALDALAQLRDTNQIAFDSRVSSDVVGQVDLWDSQKDLATDRTVLLNNVRGGTDQASRQAQMTLRGEAKSILSQTQNGIPNSQNLLATAVGDFGSFFSSPNLYTNPLANQSLEKEFSSLFIDKFSQTGNTDAAVKLASKELQRNWGVTSVGNSKLLMKYPPEKVGYRPINGSFDWINDSVRKDLFDPQFSPAEGLNPQETNLLNYSRDNMRKDTVLNQNGDITSVYITGVTGPDGKIYNVPGYADGKILTDEEALTRASTVGLDKYPSYDTGLEADVAADKVHAFINEDTARYNEAKSAPASFELFSDEQTRQEYQTFQRDANAAPPSYRIFTVDSDGVARERVDTVGKPLRLNFKPPAEVLQEQADTFDRRAARFQADDIIANYPRLEAGALASGTQVPEEDTKAFQDALKAREGLQKAEDIYKEKVRKRSGFDANDFGPGVM